MDITTVIIIIVGCLIIYYSVMVTYDLYVDGLAETNEEDENETPIDISEYEDGEFQPVSVNTPQSNQSVFSKFQNIVAAGISASHASQLMASAAEGTPNHQLKGMMIAVQNYSEQ